MRQKFRFELEKEIIARHAILGAAEFQSILRDWHGPTDAGLVGMDVRLELEGHEQDVLYLWNATGSVVGA